MYILQVATEWNKLLLTVVSCTLGAFKTVTKTCYQS